MTKKKVEESTENPVVDKTDAQVYYNDLLQLHKNLQDLNVRSIGDLENLIEKAEKEI